MISIERRERIKIAAVPLETRGNRLLSLCCHSLHAQNKWRSKQTTCQNLLAGSLIWYFWWESVESELTHNNLNIIILKIAKICCYQLLDYWHEFFLSLSLWDIRLVSNVKKHVVVAFHGKVNNWLIQLLIVFLQSLPWTVGRMTSLVTLKLDMNDLTSLPDSIGEWCSWCIYY